MKQIVFWFLVASLFVTPTVIDREAVEFVPHEADLSGRQTRILTTVPDGFDYILDPEEKNKDIVNDTAYERTATVEEYHNTEIVVIEQPNAKRELQNAVLAAMDDYDFALLPAKDAAEMMTDGYFNNLRRFEEIRFDEPWWGDIANDSLTFGDKQYAAANDISVTGLAESLVVTFFGQIFEREVYDLVRDGKWTIEKMQQYIVDGRGAIDGENAAMALMTGIGQPLLTKTEEGLPALTLTNDYLDAAGKVARLFAKTKPVKENEEAMFTVTEFKNAGINCILPLPKINAEQEAYHSLRRDDMFLAMPVTNSSPNETAAVIDTMQYISWDLLTPAYIDSKVYSTNGKRMDNDIIHFFENTRYLDLGGMMGITTSLDGRLNMLLSEGDDSVASVYAMYQTRIDADLEKAVRSIAEIAH